MEMNIVGAANDEEMAQEIEDIAKVFVYEQHMKDFTVPLRPRPSSRRHEPAKKHLLSSPVPFRASAGIKGFC